MKTYEGTITIKWFKNDSYGDRRPLTIDCEDMNELNIEKSKLNKAWMELGENGKLPYSVKIELSERN